MFAASRRAIYCATTLAAYSHNAFQLSGDSPETESHTLIIASGREVARGVGEGGARREEGGPAPLFRCTQGYVGRREFLRKNLAALHSVRVSGALASSRNDAGEFCVREFGRHKRPLSSSSLSPSPPSALPDGDGDVTHPGQFGG